MFAERPRASFSALAVFVVLAMATMLKHLRSRTPVPKCTSGHYIYRARPDSQGYNAAQNLVLLFWFLFFFFAAASSADGVTTLGVADIL